MCRTNGSKCDVIRVGSSDGTICLELLPLDDGVVRAFVRCSPRNLRLDDEGACEFSEMLSEAGYSRILVQDTKAKTIARALRPLGWSVSKAVEPEMKCKYTVVGISDLPLDENLVDQDGKALELEGTDDMIGLCMDIDDRNAWVFYSDEGETARAMTAGPRPTGMVVVTDLGDIGMAIDQLVAFLAAAKKSWAVFSRDIEEYISQYNPTPAYRMELGSPRRQEHSVAPLSKANRKMATRLFSEYYDENGFNARARLRRLDKDGSYFIFVADGGFVIVKLENDMGLLYDIYVTPECQGEGVGDELMRCAIDFIAANDAIMAYLHTSFPRAKTLYEKYGFEQVSSHLVLRLDEVALTPPPSR